MLKVKNIACELNAIAPPELAEPWDNVGLMVGDMEQPVSCVFVCLDVTSDNVQKAIACGADLIISHHPLLFSPLKRVVEDDVAGGIVRSLIKHNISVFSAHTNLDHADGGMNDILAGKLGLSNVRRFTEEESRDGEGRPLDNIGRIGSLHAPMAMSDFVEFVGNLLNCRTIRYVGDPAESVRQVALCTGSGGDGIYTAYHAGADVYVTADIRHHQAQLAFELGINLIDAGHFETENTICEFMKSLLSQRFASLDIVISDAPSYFS